MFNYGKVGLLILVGLNRVHYGDDMTKYLLSGAGRCPNFRKVNLNINGV